MTTTFAQQQKARIVSHLQDVTPEQIGMVRERVWDCQNKREKWMVESESDPNVEYGVAWDQKEGYSCTCPAGSKGFAGVTVHKSGVCKHVRWVVAAQMELDGAIAEISVAQAQAVDEEVDEALYEDLIDPASYDYRKVVEKQEEYRWNQDAYCWVSKQTGKALDGTPHQDDCSCHYCNQYRYWQAELKKQVAAQKRAEQAAIREGNRINRVVLSGVAQLREISRMAREAMPHCQ